MDLEMDLELLSSMKTRFLIKKLRASEVNQKMESAGYKVYTEGESIKGTNEVLKAKTGSFGMIYLCRSFSEIHGAIIIKTILPEHFPRMDERLVQDTDADDLPANHLILCVEQEHDEDLFFPGLKVTHLVVHAASVPDHAPTRKRVR